jgi:hypothetical protein
MGNNNITRSAIDDTPDLIYTAGMSERDAIAAINKFKLERNKDNLSREQEEIIGTSSVPGIIFGKDSQDNTSQNTQEDKEQNRQQQKPLNEGEVVLTTAEKDALIRLGVAREMQGQGIHKKIQELQDKLSGSTAEIDAISQSSKAEISRLEDELNTERKRRESLINAFNEVDPYNQFPNSNSDTFIAPQSMRGGISPRDAWKECNRLFDEESSIIFVDSLTGKQYTHQDCRNSIAFIKANHPAKDAIEAEMRKMGFLKGVSSFRGKDSATTLADIPPLIRSYLSDVVRTTYSSQFILHQFPNRKIDLNIPIGQSIDVPRFQNLESGEEPSDWLLSPETDIVSSSQPIKAVSERIEIKNYGMGKDIKTPPVNIPEFILANSLMDLEVILSTRLGYNYHKFVDRSIFRILDKTKQIVYNNRNQIALESELNGFSAGSNGQLTLDFLDELHAYAGAMKLQTHEDGCYVFCIPTFLRSQISKDLRRNQQFVSQTNIEELTNMLVRYTQNQDLGNVSGYVGTFSGFHLFVGNSFGAGGVGSVGVQEESIGGALRTTRTGLLLGVVLRKLSPGAK